MFSFCLTEFENVYWGWTGGQTIRKIDVHADVCGHVCVCSCSDITAAVTAATSRWLPCDWRPDNLPRSPHQTPMLLLLSRLASSINPPPSHLTHSSSPAFRLLLSSVSISIHHLRPLAFHLTHLLFILPVFFSHLFLPLIWCVGLPCLPSCSLHPQCSLSVSLWKPWVDISSSEVCETLIQTLLDHMLPFPLRKPRACASPTVWE